MNWLKLMNKIIGENSFRMVSACCTWCAVDVCSMWGREQWGLAAPQAKMSQESNQACQGRNLTIEDLVLTICESGEQGGTNSSIQGQPRCQITSQICSSWVGTRSSQGADLRQESGCRTDTWSRAWLQPNSEGREPQLKCSHEKE